METNSDGPRPERARRIRYLFSGLLTCGCCGGAYTLVGGKHYGCASARNKGTCGNRRIIRRNLVEERVLGGLRDSLLHPDIIAAFIEEYQQQYNEAMQTDLATRSLLEAELAKVEQSIAQIVDAVTDGMYHPSMKEKMSALEARGLAVRQELEKLGDEQPLRLHPSLSQIYRKKVAALTEALNTDETGELQIELVGELSAIMLLADEDAHNKKPRCAGNGGYSTTLVAGAGFEPAAFRL
ncbi:zinc ribbon domain-containing protein [Brucella intermedia]|uniref:zinc ribbon domain-containing protein n=1 Tax=Brucella intermedia TaxID=94625 RepID=UPI001591C92B|nr:zinc ribbon domain-containing protein [Brucella intermedia]